MPFMLPNIVKRNEFRASCCERTYYLDYFYHVLMYLQTNCLSIY